MTKLIKALSIICLILFSNVISAAEEMDASAAVTESVTEVATTFTDCAGHEPVGLIFDHTFSAVVGAEAIITAYRGYELLDDWIAPSTAGDSSSTIIAGRSTKAIFELLLSTTSMITQHEIFGHGARAREFHLPAHYNVGVFSGATYFNFTKYNQLSPSEKITFIAGGMEGTNILSRQLRGRWLRSGAIDSREASLYFATSFLDETRYIQSTRRFRDRTFSMGHDVVAYVNELNTWNPRHPLTTHQLRRQGLVNYLDPYLYYSLFSIGQYIVDGCQMFEYPMIAIGQYKYLPMMRLLLAPYGPEYQLVNYIKGPERNYIATFRYGNTGRQHSSALALDVTDLLSSDLLFIDGKMELWNQPKLYTAQSSYREKFGAAASLVARYRVIRQLDILGQVGYKTTGYMPGEELKHAPILRIGFLLNM